jgi:hypothetical protein
MKEVKYCPNHPRRKVEARGFCGACYSRLIRKEKLKLSLCIKCNKKPQRSRGMCSACYEKNRIGTRYFEPRNNTCSTCGIPTHNWGKLCSRCYRDRKVVSEPGYLDRKNYERIEKRFGITEEKYNLLLSSQENKCKICGGVNKSGRKLYIDHNHSTGEVRGLLCHNCNFLIGHCKENIEVLEKSIAYLQKYGTQGE